MENINAVAMRSLFLAPRIRRDDVEAIHIDMATAHLVASENLDAAGRRNAAQLDPAQTVHGRVVEDRTLIGRSVEANIMNAVVRR